MVNHHQTSKPPFGRIFFVAFSKHLKQIQVMGDLKMHIVFFLWGDVFFCPPVDGRIPAAVKKIPKKSRRTIFLRGFSYISGVPRLPIIA